MKVDLTVEELAAFYTLAAVPQIGYQRMRTLLTHYKSARRIFDISDAELATIEGFDTKIIAAVTSAQIDRESLEKARHVKDREITLHYFLNSNYPPRLKQIPNPPLLLYSSGTFTEDDEQALAIVGTRSSSTYGHEVTKTLAAELSRNGFTIVSGLARGIDTQAHWSTVHAGGRTIAVLGSGLDQIYPRDNTDLAREITRKGCVCTEYELGAQPDAGHFPERNRIISGLTMGTIVIEAGHKSGALLTAFLALEQNREVFAVPGDITKNRSIGTNRLIKHGAKLVQTVDDILDELTGQLNFMSAASSSPTPDLDVLSEQQRKIYQALSEEPRHIDNLAQDLNLSPMTILNDLLQMELHSLVKQLPGKHFVRAQP